MLHVSTGACVSSFRGLGRATLGIASFFNVSQELANVKLKSIFTGETETLEDFGVVMAQTNLKAYAQSHEMSGNIESMTRSQLVMLRYQYLFDELNTLTSGTKTEDASRKMQSQKSELGRRDIRCGCSRNPRYD